MKAALGILVVSLMAFGLAGCHSEFDANYKTEVKETPEQQAKEKEIMKDQHAPGTAPDRNAAAGGNPSQLSVPGKGGH